MKRADWTPTPKDPARRLFQVRRMLVTMPFLPAHDHQGLEEFADNLEKHVTEDTKDKRK